jgi:hypothetical protein
MNKINKPQQENKEKRFSVVEKLHNIYKKHNRVLDKYSGKEDLLLREVEKKYCSASSTTTTTTTTRKPWSYVLKRYASIKKQNWKRTAKPRNPRRR